MQYSPWANHYLTLSIKGVIFYIIQNKWRYYPNIWAIWFFSLKFSVAIFNSPVSLEFFQFIFKAKLCTEIIHLHLQVYATGQTAAMANAKKMKLEWEVGMDI